ncbi:hypothetical protein VKT23_019202 [Stygiomarasmius scandens]|uniref:Fungal-type protein kinase domain-containing protein n=1 Tax=Marasmiellus scandens TaxID=2682957 RepID=A0ABR1IPA3_9AGAR
MDQSSTTPKPTPRKMNQRNPDALKAERTTVLSNLNRHTIEVNVTEFRQHYLPFRMGDSLYDSCIEKLRQNETIKDEKWSTFSSPPPSSGENEYFSKLKDVVASICDWFSKLDGQKATRTTAFTCQPFSKTDSEIAGSSFHLDGRFYQRQSTATSSNSSTRNSCDNVVPLEFKLKRDIENVEDNRRKLGGAVAHLMNNDPCRRHIYGMTIECHSVRLWFFSRSHCVKSSAFDLSSDLRPMIHFVLAMSFSTPEQLGFDPTISRIYGPNLTNCTSPRRMDVYYIYQVNGQCYRTIRLLCEYFPLSVPGRAARVWVVSKCNSSGVVTEAREYVSKDYWLDDGGGNEKEIQQQIFQCLENLRSTPSLIPSDKLPDDSEEKLELIEALKIYEQYFITIHDFQQISSTLDILRPYQCCGVVDSDLKPKQPFPPSITSTVRSANSTDNTLSWLATGTTIHENRKFVVKHQCRVVYSECLQTVAALRDFGDISAAMYDCVTAIQLLYLVGYIHCDISSGNVYYGRSEQDSEKIGKLSDLEYARPFQRPAESFAVDPKTGTQAFMSVEVKTQQYIWAPDPTLDISTTFRHHYLHDVESTFWLGLWLFTTRAAHSADPDIQKQANYVAELFLNDAFRRSIIQKSSYSPEIFGTIPNDKRPAVHQAFANFSLARSYHALSSGYEKEQLYRNGFKVAKEAFKALKQLGTLPCTNLFVTGPGKDGKSANTAEETSSSDTCTADTDDTLTSDREPNPVLQSGLTRGTLIVAKRKADDASVPENAERRKVPREDPFGGS